MATFLAVRADRLRGIVARWRRAGYAQTARLGPGPAWCWLTRSGLAVTGQRYATARPALSRLAHIRAVLAIRLSLEVGDAYRDGQAWWRSERRIRAAAGGQVGGGHVPDAELFWPDLAAGAYAGQCWAIEAELTPKPLARTAAIMTALLARTADYQPSAPPGPGPRYDRVIYLASPAAHGVVERGRRELAAWAARPGGGAGAAGRGGAVDVVVPARPAHLVAAACHRPGDPLGGAGRCLGRCRSGDRSGRRWAGRGVAAWLAAGPAAPCRVLVAADDRGLSGRAGVTGQDVAGACPGPGPGLADGLARVSRRASGHGVRAVCPGCGPCRSVRCGRVVGVADLRDRERAGGQDRHRAGSVRRPSVAPRVARCPCPGHRPGHVPAR